jgi:hypothetical protein
VLLNQTLRLTKLPPLQNETMVAAQPCFVEDFFGDPTTLAGLWGPVFRSPFNKAQSSALPIITTRTELTIMRCGSDYRRFKPVKSEVKGIYASVTRAPLSRTQGVPQSPWPAFLAQASSLR